MDNPKNLRTQAKTSPSGLSSSLPCRGGPTADVAVLMDWKRLLLSNLETPVCEAKLIKRLSERKNLPAFPLGFILGDPVSLWGLLLKWGAVKWKAQR